MNGDRTDVNETCGVRATGSKCLSWPRGSMEESRSHREGWGTTGQGGGPQGRVGDHRTGWGTTGQGRGPQGRVGTEGKVGGPHYEGYKPDMEVHVYILAFR